MVSQELHADRFGDIEEALAELFDASTILDEIGGGVVAGIEAVGDKLKRACFLLDRRWE